MKIIQNKADILYGKCKPIQFGHLGSNCIAISWRGKLSDKANKCRITTSFDLTVPAIKWKIFCPLIASKTPPSFFAILAICCRRCKSRYHGLCFIRKPSPFLFLTYRTKSIKTEKSRYESYTLKERVSLWLPKIKAEASLETATAAHIHHYDTSAASNTKSCVAQSLQEASDHNTQASSQKGLEKLHSASPWKGNKPCPAQHLHHSSFTVLSDMENTLQCLLLSAPSWEQWCFPYTWMSGKSRDPCTKNQLLLLSNLIFPLLVKEGRRKYTSEHQKFFQSFAETPSISQGTGFPALWSVNFSGYLNQHFSAAVITDHSQGVHS